MIKWSKCKEFISRRKLRTKLLFLILAMGALCLTLFRFLWNKKWDVYYFLSENIPSRLQILPLPDEDIWIKLSEEAKKHNLPSSENDKEAIDDLKPFFALADEYTSIHIYGLVDGLYRAGTISEKMLWNEPFNTFFSMTYRWIDEDVDQIYERAMEFKNSYAHVIISFYHSSFFFVPYAMFCLILCTFLFLFVILFFVGRKLKIIVHLKKNILQMSSGDLQTPIPGAGLDEIGILSLELDHLRLALYETIQKEQNIRKSNQELIAALSHDLRTPLTILKGYLEIVQLNRSPSMQAEYISRCLKKADDIQEMSDRMFEYALVYDEEADDLANLTLLELPLHFFLDTLQEHSDFLCLAGFRTDLNIPDTDDSKDKTCPADPAMVKRIFNNLFSNILKYADKRESVEIFAGISADLTILLKNSMKSDYGDVESTQIGLKSVQKMLERLGGTLRLDMKDGFFVAELHFLIS